MGKKLLNASEMGKIGGARKYERYGKEEYSNMGKKGGAKLLEERGPEYFRKIRQIGIAKKKQKKDSAIITLTKMITGEK